MMLKFFKCTYVVRIWWQYCSVIRECRHDRLFEKFLTSYGIEPTTYRVVARSLSQLMQADNVEGMATVAPWCWYAGSPYKQRTGSSQMIMYDLSCQTARTFQSTIFSYGQTDGRTNWHALHIMRFYFTSCTWLKKNMWRLTPLTPTPMSW